MLPILDQVVDTAVENLSPYKQSDDFDGDTTVNCLDLDILINCDERVTSATYVTLLTALS
jgi:hypothetical protein